MSVQKWRVISRSPGNVQKFCHYPPPPSERGPHMKITENCWYYPPPPPNLVGFWRSRKIYRVASAGWPPPKQKSWLRRCARQPDGARSLSTGQPNILRTTIIHHGPCPPKELFDISSENGNRRIFSEKHYHAHSGAPEIERQ